MKVHVDRRTSEKKRERNKNNDKSKKKFEFKIDKDAPLVTENEKVAEMPTTQAVFNTDGKMVFSRFDFSESGIPQQRTGEYSGKDYKKLLKKSTKDQEKIRKLEQIDQAKADNVKNKKKWKAALERAQGIKVKDDPVLLKKGMKRTQQRHKKSKKKWDERVEFIKQKQEKKQKKRMENIQARKKEKTAKKIKRSLKKGRLIPGFS